MTDKLKFIAPIVLTLVLIVPGGSALVTSAAATTDGDRKLNKTENIIYMASQDGWQQVVSTFYATHGCKYNSSDEKFHCPKNMCAVWYTEVGALEDKLDAHSTEDELAAYNRQADAYNARCT